MNLIIINKSYYFSTILIASLLFVLLSSDHSIGDDYKETVNYSYAGTDIKLKLEEQRFIHLSLPADEYIMRLRSKGDFDLYIQPKDKTSFLDNLFVRECDTAIITINTDRALMHSPICISGHIVEDENANKKPLISINSQQHQETYKIGDANDGAESKSSADMPNKEENKRFSYYIDTITEQLVEIRCINKPLLKKIKQYSKNQGREGVSICGYYKISNECPYIEVHWVEDRKAFKNILKSNKMLKRGLWGLW